MVESPEVVITGVGVVSPIGIGKEAYWEALCAGRSGVGPLTRFDATRLPVSFGAEVRDFDPKLYVKPRKSLKVMSREIQLAFAAAGLAVDDAALAGAFDPDRLGVVFGAGMISSEFGDLEEVYLHCLEEGRFRFERWGAQAMADVFPLWMLKYLPNMPACHIGIAHDARGPTNTITLGEVSSLLAFAEAANIIRRGHADVMIVGGASSRVTLVDWIWRGDALLSHRSDDPAAASRPFDAMRDGMVSGEGAAAFVLERRSHAEARGAQPLARVLGASSVFESQRNGPAGLRKAVSRSIRQALHASRMTPGDVGHVNAHGASTQIEDAAEAQAIREILGDVPVTAPKSYFGCLGEGSGAVEAVASVLGLVHGQTPPTLNYTLPDPECPVNVVHGRPLPDAKRVALLLNHARTGQAAALVLSGM